MGNDQPSRSLLFSRGEPARNYAAAAIDMACRGEDAKAYLDKIEDPAKRALAKAQARAMFAKIQHLARTAAKLDVRDVRRYLEKNVHEGLRDHVATYSALLRSRAGG